MSSKKYYVVWKGLNPGIYDTWNSCKEQVAGFDDALYKSFDTREAAREAFDSDPWKYIGKNKKKPLPATYPTEIIRDSLAVDAACSGNPGKMEYRGVHVISGKEVFHVGPYEKGTNNIGEFLAIVHGLALLKKQDIRIPIYTDSVNAILWVKNKKCKTKLERSDENTGLFEVIERAENWLKNNSYQTKIIKWETEKWGEIPADFGRK